jgi:hypothetical protein
MVTTVQAAKEVNASQDIIITLLTRIGNFFRRLESYTAVPPTLLIRDMVVKIMVEVLHILAIVTTEIRLGRRSELISSDLLFVAHLCTGKYLKQLLRKSNVEDALKTLDMLTQEEARMVIAEILKVTHMVDDKMRILIDGAQNVSLLRTSYPQQSYGLSNRSTNDKQRRGREAFVFS